MARSSGATASSYTIAADQTQVGKFFKVVVSASDGSLSSSALSNDSIHAVDGNRSARGSSANAANIALSTSSGSAHAV